MEVTIKIEPAVWTAFVAQMATKLGPGDERTPEEFAEQEIKDAGFRLVDKEDARAYRRTRTRLTKADVG